MYSPKKNDDAGYKNEIRMKNGLALGDGSNRASGVSIGISKPLFLLDFFLKIASSDASVELLFLSQSKQCNKLVYHPNHWVSEYLRDSVDSAQLKRIL